jgi:hypothetical protein
MPLTTRKPTGKAPWPIMLLAGSEKSGKSYACAQASASKLIGRTLWVGVGEDAPDEYGALPGARFEIVEHDGTYRGILNALAACAAEPSKDVPNLIVLDSATRLWDLLCDEQQHVANERARRKAAKFNKPLPDEDATITMDQWNTAKQRWGHCIDTLREHQGPSIVTARLESVTVLDGKGQPTTDRTWKVKAEKSLPYDVGVVVEMPARGDTWLTGVRSLRWTATEPRVQYPDFTVEKLWTDLGLAEKDAAGERHHAANDPEDKPAQEADTARTELGALCDERGWDKAAVAAAFAEREGGVQIKEADAPELRKFMAWLGEHWQTVQAGAAA